LASAFGPIIDNDEDGNLKRHLDMNIDF